VKQEHGHKNRIGSINKATEVADKMNQSIKQLIKKSSVAKRSGNKTFDQGEESPEQEEDAGSYLSGR
jgi:hypothetical protein